MLDGGTITVLPDKYGCRLLAADRSGRFGTTFTFCCNESAAWSAEAAIHWLPDGLDWWQGEDGWHPLSSGLAEGPGWDWDLLESRDGWEWGVLWTLVTTARDGELDDGRDARVVAVPGFVAPVVAAVRCECDEGTHELAVEWTTGAFVALAFTPGTVMTLVALTSQGVVLQRKMFDL